MMKNFLLQRHKNKLNYLIFESYKTLLILKEKNIIKKKFPLLTNLDRIEYILLSFSLGLTYSNTFS